MPPAAAQVGPKPALAPQDGGAREDEGKEYDKAQGTGENSCALGKRVD